jgi:hypothetical protein
MKKSFVISIVAVLLALVAIAISASVFIRHNDKDLVMANEATIKFSENGYERDVGRITVLNYAKDLQFTATFHIVNNTGYDIVPTIESYFNVNPDDYSKIEGEGFVAVPSYYSDWIDIPKVGLIKDGNDARYGVKLKIPGSYEGEIPDKWAFWIITGSNTGGMFQAAPAVWWLVEMR